MAKRSPILGYNHNVRYRGLVFHVQTEDSGVLAPHVFTHLFHGGVILSTRKLVYDAGASEDVIRSLMQAQHKAVLKELRRGSFDDKIDEYLGGNPDLLPRGMGESSPEISVSGGDGEGATTEPIPVMQFPEPAAAEPAAAALAVESVEPAVPQAAALPVPMRPLPGIPRPKTGPVAPVVTFRDEPTGPSPLEAAAQAAQLPVEPLAAAAAVTPPLTERKEPVMPVVPAPAGRSGTAPRISAGAPPRPAITQPVVVAREMDAASAEIYSPPPPTAAAPPGLAEAPGAYSVRRRDATAEPAPPVRGVAPREASRPTPAAGAAVPPRVPSPAPPKPGAAPPAARASQPALPTTPAAAARSAPRPSTAPVAGSVPAPSAAPAAPPRARPTGGVVMTRPAVIVGAPRTSPPATKARSGSEDDRRGFGQGLISEKSLDEVILAYLSEDANDE